MSPILVRPVREQLEHDRIIRLLQTKCRRKYEVGMNPGAEQNAVLGNGPSAVCPDLLLFSTDRGRRLEGVIEVETGESVNHLEALAQWVPYSRQRAPFHLYVPAGMVDVARRLCQENQILAHEIWSFHSVGDQIRFTLVHRSREAAEAVKAVVRTPARPPEKAARPSKPPRLAARKPARPAKPAPRAKKGAKPVKRAKNAKKKTAKRK